jgi:fermentation-respiration switch protein FrsA (DUF1100 family)
MPFLKHFTFLCHQQWPSEKSIRHIVKTPILFLAGAKDELVPPSHMVQLHELSDTRANKIWVPFPNGMHNDTCMQPGYFTAIREYLETYILKKEQEVEQELVEEKTNTIDKTYIDGKPVNDQAYQLVSGVMDEEGMTHSFQVEEVELDDEE